MFSDRLTSHEIVELPVSFVIKYDHFTNRFVLRSLGADRDVGRVCASERLRSHVQVRY